MPLGQWETLSDLETSIQTCFDAIDGREALELETIEGISLGDSTQEKAVFHLTDLRRVTVEKFHSKTLINIREFYSAGEGELKPGRKGIALTGDQWVRLMKDKAEITKTFEEIC